MGTPIDVLNRQRRNRVYWRETQTGANGTNIMVRAREAGRRHGVLKVIVNDVSGGATANLVTIHWGDGSQLDWVAMGVVNAFAVDVLVPGADDYEERGPENGDLKISTVLTTDFTVWGYTEDVV